MFVMRDEYGVIVGVFSTYQYGYAEEYLPDDHKELNDFYVMLKEQYQ